MDANGTRFHLLLGERDWASCRDAADPRTTLAAHFRRAPSPCGGGDDAGFGWIEAGAALTLRPCLVQFDAAPSDRPPDPSGADRRGAARDRFGNIYWIAGSSSEIRIISAAGGVATHFWSAGEELPPPPDGGYGRFHAVEPGVPAAPGDRPAAPGTGPFSGLAITDDHYLLVGVVDPAGLLVFDLHAGGPPQRLAWPAGVPGGFVPFDLAPRPGGGVWVLDRAGRRYWGFDRHLAVEALGGAPEALDPGRRDDFQPLDPEPVRRTAPRLYPAAIPIDAEDPVAIEGLPDGTVLILDRAAGHRHARLLRDGIARRFGTAEAIGPSTLDAYDIAFAPSGDGGSPAGRLYAASVEGNQASAYDLTQDDAGRLSMTLASEYFPMRLFGGKALIASASQAFYDFFDGWIPLVAQRRPRYAQSAALETPVFDGREPECVWHRLMIDACIPPDTAVRVRTRAADEAAALEAAQWQPEPDPYLRRDGSELPFDRGVRGDGEGTWELLFQRARGRYLQIEVTLAGNGRATPRVRALRAYYPRFSYLERYMPAVYREDATSASFLDRFLANAEGFLTTTEGRIAAAEVLFDVRNAPPETLDWLASWFGVALDPSWTEARRRLFIAHAMDFFRRRGTPLGLQAAIRLAIDDCVDATVFADQPVRRRGLDQVRIVETWRTRRTPAVVAGDPTGPAGPREVPAAERWHPAQGRRDLTGRYLAWLMARGITAPPASEFPVVEPGSADDARLWRAFAQETLGFVPSGAAADAAAFQSFLDRRYREAGTLARAYGTAVSGDLLPPERLPPDGPMLADWYDFESIVTAMRRTAHRFSVLLPVPRGGNIETLRLDRLDLVRRVVELEKPAHTVFDVKFYWALFRVGDARLGDDTLIDRGGRAPDLLPPIRLGQAYLAETVLAPGHPQDVAGRRIVGRDSLEAHVSQEAPA